MKRGLTWVKKLTLQVLAEVLLYVHRTVGLLGTGAQDGHLNFHTAVLTKPGLKVIITTDEVSKHGV